MTAAASAGPAVLPNVGYNVRWSLTHNDGSYRIFAGNSRRCATAAVIVPAVDITEKRQRFDAEWPASFRSVGIVFIASFNRQASPRGRPRVVGAGSSLAPERIKKAFPRAQLKGMGAVSGLKQ